MMTFLLTSAVILLTPGPTNTVLAAFGAANGLRQSRLLPLAEAAGYSLAITFFVLTAAVVEDVWWALPGMKILASAWLAFSAVRLWSMSPEGSSSSGREAFRRVLFTTIFNPKAMIVGTMFIPQATPAVVAEHVGSFVILSTIAGFGWVLLGSMLPGAIRRHSYKGAAFVLGGFSLAAVSSAFA